MKIAQYDTRLSKDKRNLLVKEGELRSEERFFDSPEKIVKLVNDNFNMNRRTEEYVYMLALTSQSEVIGVFEISHGTVHSASISPREIFVKAVLCGATGVILVHNHPGGTNTPSSMDRIGTERVCKAGKLVGISLLDHIIICGDGYVSMRERGELATDIIDF